MRRVLLVLALAVVGPRAASPQGGAPIGPEFLVNTYTTTNQLYPSVTTNATGNFVVVWTSNTQDGDTLGIFGQRYAASGAPLGPEFRVNSYTTGAQYLPSVASDGFGQFVVVWTSTIQDGDGLGVFGQRYSSTGAPLGTEFRVNTYTTGNQTFPTVSVNNETGGFVVAWMSYQQDGSSWGVFGQRYQGVPLGPEFRVNTYTTAAQYAPSVAMDAAGGNFAIVWASNTQDGSGRGVFGQRYDLVGSPAGPEFRVNTYTTGNQYQALIAKAVVGNFVVAWTSAGQDGSLLGIFGQQFGLNGTPFGAEFRVNTYTTSYQHRPAVAKDGIGNFVVTWSSYTQDGFDEGVFGQRYVAAGTPVGPEFRVNTYTTYAQTRPSVAADGVGNFVVTWDSQTQDGSFLGVFGQRYGQIVPVELMQFGVE